MPSAQRGGLNSRRKRRANSSSLRGGCMPAAGAAACPAEHGEAVLLGQRCAKARRVRRVVVAEHCGLAWGSLGACRLGAH